MSILLSAEIVQEDTVMPKYLVFSDVEEWYLRSKENLRVARAQSDGVEEAMSSFVAAQSALGCLLEEIWPG